MQRTDIGKYSFVVMIIRNWNQLPSEALGNFPSKPKRIRKRVMKAMINGSKSKEQNCGENNLKVQRSEKR